MKFLFVFLNPEIRTGGHRRYLELASGLAERGHEVFLVKNSRLEASGIDKVRCIELEYRYKKKFLPYSVYGAGKILTTLGGIGKETGPCDYVVVFGETHLFAGIVLRLRVGGGLVFAYRSNGVEENRRYLLEAGGTFVRRLGYHLAVLKYMALEKLVGLFSDLIVFQSEYDKESFLSRVRSARDKVRVIRGNIGEPWYGREYADTNRSTGLRNVAFLGSLNERKGIRHLIEAFMLLHGETPDLPLTLHVYGKGVLEEELKRLVRDSGLEEKILFHGKTPRPFDAVTAADLIVVPSLFDSYPNVVLEALHTGTPVLASRTGGIPDILRHEELLFEPGSPLAVADKIRELFTREGAYHRLRELCRSRLEYFRFDWPGEWEKEMKNDKASPSS